LQLGQAATTLSGGEAQRMKLSAELAKKDTGKTVYLLDEPTTGLHFADVAKLLEVLERLRDKGNTLIVIEHNLDVVKTADWIVDLGPEGGEGGGEVVAAGTPEDVAAVEKSYTGQFLRPLLAKASKTAGKTQKMVEKPVPAPENAPETPEKRQKRQKRRRKRKYRPEKRRKRPKNRQKRRKSPGKPDSRDKGGAWEGAEGRTPSRGGVPARFPLGAGGGGCGRNGNGNPTGRKSP
jgi:ABC-type glutathione transport system ATPase component